METGIVTHGELLDALKSSGNEFRSLDLNGPVGYVSRVGGRNIGVFPGDDRDASNALWLPSNYREMLKNPRGWNVGGGRLWKGPEFSSKEVGNVTYFCQEPGNYGKWECQKAMDPGDYSIEDSHSVPGGVVLQNAGKIRDFASGNEHNFGFYRFFDPTKKMAAPKGTICANIDFIDSITSAAEHFHAWDLVQLFPGLATEPGTIIFPVETDREHVIAVYMNKTGQYLGEAVKVGNDHVSIRTQQMLDKRYKLANPPDSAIQISENGLDYYYTIMHITKVPGTNDRYQLAVMRSRTHSSEEGKILEVSSVEEADLRGLPPYLKGGRRGECFVYNGPSPDGETCFTEAELVGNGSYGSGKSAIVGSMTFCWGDAEAIMGAARQFGQFKELPYVFGLNE